MPPELTVYHLPQCSTCKGAIKQLKSLGNDLELRHIVEQTPSADELRKLIADSGLPIQKFFNVSGDVYREMGLKDKLPRMTEDEKLVLLASNGMLIKRPIVSNGIRTTVGHKEETYRSEWGSRHG